MSFVEELKRRNVFKVGIAYLVGGWLLLQMTEVLSELLKLPDTVGPIVVFMVAIGFPIAIFLAWAFEMTPEGVKREADVDRSQSVTPDTGKKLNLAISVMLALAVVYLLFDKFSGPEPVSTPAVDTAASDSTLDTQPAADSSSDTRQSIAVLPFENRSNREEDQFFTDGIHDDLLTTIARIGSMKVISRTSVMEYKNTTKKIPEIAKELGVANILEGGIQRSGDQVRINVQLIDAQTDEHLWAEIFDRELTAKNLFAIQSEISQKIADALETTLSPEETARINTMPTQDLAAFEAYIRGKQSMATREIGKLEEAILEFRNAVDLDPSFALAWVGIADSYSLLYVYGSFDRQEGLVIRQDAVDRALEIDPMLGEAYVALASIHWARGEQEEMEIAYKKGNELSPNYAPGYQWYGDSLRGLSRGQQRFDLYVKAAELDPRSDIIGVGLGDRYGNQGLYSRAEQQYRKVIDLNPDFGRVYYSRAWHYALNQGRFDLAIQDLHTALKLDPDSLISLSLLVSFSLEIGDIASANQFRQMIAGIGDQDYRLGLADMAINNSNGNIDGIREAWQWMSSRFPRFGASEFAASLELAFGSPANARKIYLRSEPDWVDPEAWGRLVDINPPRACLVAWTLAQTGDEKLGTALLDQSLAFIDTLPGLIENVDKLPLQHCYLVAGDTEKALTHIESQLAHNRLTEWKINDQLPMYEPIRFEPRYQAAMAERERRIAEQHTAVEQMNLGKGP